MSELYSQKEISEMLKEFEVYKEETIVMRKELQIEKAISQNRAEAYYRTYALNYDLNLQIQEANKQLEIYKKALELACLDLVKHCCSKVNFEECRKCPLYSDCANSNDVGIWDGKYLLKARGE